MGTILQLLPEGDHAEVLFLSNLLKNNTEEEIKVFISIYRARRRDPQIVLLTALAGFLGFAGIHRILVNHIGMGVLYLLTLGLCFIGTIVDLVNYKNLAMECNQKIALEVQSLLGE